MPKDVALSCMHRNYPHYYRCRQGGVEGGSEDIRRPSALMDLNLLRVVIYAFRWPLSR